MDPEINIIYWAVNEYNNTLPVDQQRVIILSPLLVNLKPFDNAHDYHHIRYALRYVCTSPFVDTLSLEHYLHLTHRLHGLSDYIDHP